VSAPTSNTPEGAFFNLHAEFDVYDALPAPLRLSLRQGAFDISAIESQQVLEEYGLSETRTLLALTEQELLKDSCHPPDIKPLR